MAVTTRWFFFSINIRIIAGEIDGIRGDIKWNFTKFLVGPDGRVVARFESGVEPTSDEIVSAIEALLPADA